MSSKYKCGKCGGGLSSKTVHQVDGVTYGLCRNKDCREERNTNRHGDTVVEAEKIEDIL